MKQALGFQDSSRPNHVCLLQRSFYRLKQALCSWFHRLNEFISRMGFTNSKFDSSLFIYMHESHIAHLLLYVDDIVLTGS